MTMRPLEATIALTMAWVGTSKPGLGELVRGLHKSENETGAKGAYIRPQPFPARLPMPTTWDKIREIKEHFEQLLLRKANVVGVAVGHKVTDGRETDEPCIVVLVKRKLPEGQLRPDDVVPRRLNNVSTDVVESGEIKALQLLNMQGKPRTARWRPAPGGVSIGHIDVTAGTLGCLVERNGEVFILSNNHVLANANLGKVGDPIPQPSV
jgi:hypothetical protein